MSHYRAIAYEVTNKQQLSMLANNKTTHSTNACGYIMKDIAKYSGFQC